MTTYLFRNVLTGLMLLALSWPALAAEDKAAAVYPVALLPFQERGPEVKGFSGKVTDLLFADLVANPDLFLVEREDLQKVLDELKLSLTGLVRSDQATAVGRLTGAKILVTGSVIQVDKSVYVVAKIIGTETSRVLGASVKGEVAGDLAPLVDELAGEVGKTIKTRARQLVARQVRREDRIAALKERLGGKRLPAVLVALKESHVGQASVDPAAATELTLLLTKTGFTVIDPEKGKAAEADVVLQGEGLSEFAGRMGELVSVKARLEVKAVDRASGKVLAADRQTAVVVDLTEQLAGKAALQEAAAQMADRLLPKIAKSAPRREKREEIE
jgi:TolB-like protein/ribosomal protein L14